MHSVAAAASGHDGAASGVSFMHDDRVVFVAVGSEQHADAHDDGRDEPPPPPPAPAPAPAPTRARDDGADGEAALRLSDGECRRVAQLLRVCLERLLQVRRARGGDRGAVRERASVQFNYVLPPLLQAVPPPPPPPPLVDGVAVDRTCDADGRRRERSSASVALTDVEPLARQTRQRRL